MTLEKAFFRNLDTKETLPVQFNPSDLVYNKTAQFAEIAIPGLDQPVLQFIRGGTETLTLELFFDTTDQGMAEGAKPVTEELEKFYRLVKQDPQTHAPPKCLFAWGEKGRQGAGSPSTGGSVSQAPFWFVCVVESIDRKFTLFSAAGIPLRARLTVKLREYQSVAEMAGRLQSADLTKVRLLQRGQRLDQLAAAEYGDPAHWRLIAAANEVDDPRHLQPGTMLQLPPLKAPTAVRGTP